MAVESKAMDHIRRVLEQFGDKYFTKSGGFDMRLLNNVPK